MIAVAVILGAAVVVGGLTWWFNTKHPMPPETDSEWLDRQW